MGKLNKVLKKMREESKVHEGVPTMITDEIFIENVQLVRSLINDHKIVVKAIEENDFKSIKKMDGKYAFKIDNEIKFASLKVVTAIANSVYDDSLDRGSALFPLFNSNWSIGGFGSIWCDTKIDNKEIRIHLIDKNVVYTELL